MSGHRRSDRQPPWSAADTALLLRLRDEDKREWPSIALQLKRPVAQCYAKHWWEHNGRRAAARRAVASNKAVIDAARRARARDGRDLTAAICGDPPPGFSALDRKRREEAR